jgi:hypothetical protein
VRAGINSGTTQGGTIQGGAIRGQSDSRAERFEGGTDLRVAQVDVGLGLSSTRMLIQVEWRGGPVVERHDVSQPVRRGLVRDAPNEPVCRQNSRASRFEGARFEGGTVRGRTIRGRHDSRAARLEGGTVRGRHGSRRRASPADILVVLGEVRDSRYTGPVTSDGSAAYSCGRPKHRL